MNGVRIDKKVRLEIGRMVWCSAGRRHFFGHLTTEENLIVAHISSHRAAI
jgi:hypothetical protein